MKIQTISLVAGEGQCPRHCPYCVSRMTGKAEFSQMPKYISDKVKRALWLAEQSGVSTALITGKGEPLFEGKSRSHVFQYLNMLQDFRIPFIEIQTSGYGLTEDVLREFSFRKVTTVAISVVSDSLCGNRAVFGAEYENPFQLAKAIHRHGMMVRLSCTLCRGYVESWEAVRHLIDSCRLVDIEQVSFVPVTAPDESENAGVAKWVREHALGDRRINRLYDQIRDHGTKMLTLVHGGEVYDISGVSVAIRFCLTEDAETSTMRQVIVYPNGETRYSWTLRGARLIRGDPLE